MTSKLQKLSAITKHAALFLLIFTCAVGTSYAQVFPSQVRIVAGAEYSMPLLPEQNKNIRISPDVFLGMIMEFKQLYALQLALQGNIIDTDNPADTRAHPTLGFTYDLYMKLYRSDPAPFVTPIMALSISKQWSIVKTDDSVVRNVMNDATDWKFKTLAGLEFAIGKNFRVKPQAGLGIVLAETSYYESKIYPVFRLSTDVWF